MLPQFNSEFYFSQLFWLFVCFAILVFAFKKHFIPRMDSLLSKRGRYLEKTDDVSSKLEKEILILNAEIAKIQAEELRHSAEIVASARKKVAILVNEQVGLIKEERDALLHSTRGRLTNEMKSLESAFKIQVEIITESAFDKLFTQRI